MKERLEKDALGKEITSDTRIRKPTGIVVSIRFERELADRILSISEGTGKSLSQVVREAVISYGEPPRTESLIPPRSTDVERKSHDGECVSSREDMIH